MFLDKNHSAEDFRASIRDRYICSNTQYCRETKHWSHQSSI